MVLKMAKAVAVNTPVMDVVDETTIIKPISYPVALKEIRSLGARVLKLTIKGVDDEAGREAVKQARKECQVYRKAIEDKRNELLEDSREYTKKVNSVAATLQEALAPFEKHCKSEQDRINAEIDRIENERLDQLFEIRQRRWTESGGDAVTREFLMQFSAEEFDVQLELAAESARKKQEAARLAAQQAEEMRKQQERIKAERDELLKAQQATAVLNQRMKKLNAVRAFHDMDDVAEWTDEQFDREYSEAKRNYDSAFSQSVQTVQPQRTLFEESSVSGGNTSQEPKPDQFAATRKAVEEYRSSILAVTLPSVSIRVLSEIESSRLKFVADLSSLIQSLNQG